MMEPDFAASTTRWFALAAQTLGWRPADFWAATPRELASAWANPIAPTPMAAPSRDWIEQMMERDAHG